jgi:hypothetical protein
MVVKKYYFYVSGTYFCYRLSKPQGLVRPEGLGTFKKITSVFEPTTLRFVALCPNHYATGPVWTRILTTYESKSLRPVATTDTCEYRCIHWIVYSYSSVALQSMMCLGLFYDCSPLVSILRLPLNPVIWWQICLPVKYPLAYLEFSFCNGSALTLQKIVPVISIALHSSLSINMVHYNNYKIHGSTLIPIYHFP